MNRTSLVMAIAAGAIVTAPVLAQQNQDSAAPPNREETAPLQLKAGQITELQQRLNKQGFSTGYTDGLWGLDTSAAVMKFQQKNGLQATGQLDQTTLKALGAVTAAASPAMQAQNTEPTSLAAVGVASPIRGPSIEWRRA